MKKFINKIKNNKTLSILSVLIIGVFFLLITRVTFAFLAPIFNSAQTDVMGASDTVDDFKFELGNPLKIDATPTTLKENGTNYVTSTTAKALLKANSTQNTATYNYYVYFEIKSNTFTYSYTYTDGSRAEIILTVTNPNGDEVTSIEGLTYGTFDGISGFDVTTKSGLFNIADNYEITSNSSTAYTTQEWNITLTYLNLSIDQSSNFGNSMEVSVYIRKEEKIITVADVCSSGQTLNSCIIAMDGKDYTLINHYNKHDYRYAGSSDSVNNFVCFGTNESPCPTDNLYRIVGVINEKVKLIKYDYATSDLLGTDGDYSGSSTPGSSYNGVLKSINTYYWNYKATDNAINTWSTSLLNKTNLNTNFLNNIGEEWANRIAMTTWKVGGNFASKIIIENPSVAYTNEITNPDATNSTDNATEYEAKVGLIYVSDYGYAASPESWTTSMKYYGNVVDNNWMYMGYYEWTITRMSGDSTEVVIVYSRGNVGTVSDSDYAVRPVFNLEPSITYVSGSGKMIDPIVIN